jgi:hypothetical protein
VILGVVIRSFRKADKTLAGLEKEGDKNMMLNMVPPTFDALSADPKRGPEESLMGADAERGAQAPIIPAWLSTVSNEGYTLMPDDHDE